MVTTIIPAKPLYMSETDLIIEDDDFAAAISSVAMTPSAAIATVKGLKKGSSFSHTSDPTWTCDITFTQNWDDDDSLSVYLFKNQGKSVNAIFRPKSGGRAITAKIQITAGAMGGALDTYVTSTVSLGVEGAPELGPVVTA